MKKQIHIFSYFLLLVMFTACSKTETTFTPDPNQPSIDTNWVANPGFTAVDRYMDDVCKPFFTDSILNYAGGLREYPNERLKLYIPQDCFAEPNGDSIMGEVKLQVKVLRSKGEYIKSRINTTLNTSLLNNNFYVNIKAFRNGHEVVIKQGRSLYIECVDAVTTSPVQAYTGGGTSSSVEWLTATNSQVLVSPLSSTEAAYKYAINKTGWSSVGNNFANGISTTKIFVTLPVFYTNVNTQTFLVFNDSRTATRMTADVNGKFFFQGNLPVGKNFSVVSVSIINGKYYWGYGPATISNNLIIQLRPAESNATSINNSLNSL